MKTGFSKLRLVEKIGAGQQNGAHAILRRTLFLTGALGLPVPVFYIAVSRGAVLQLPETDVLLAAFVLLIAFFRAKGHSDTVTNLN